MTSDVVLSAALRNNLLSLQNTQRGIDSTQLKLSSGRKINSALDNPQSFFASQALTNRANDLTRLLDGIGQSIQVIKAADNGVTALTSLINQADSIATQAQEALTSANSATAKITGTVDLSSGATLIGQGGIVNGNNFVVTSIDSAGTKVAKTITINTGDTGQILVDKITAAFVPSQGEITGSLDSSGHIKIEAAAGFSFRIDQLVFAGGASVATSQAALGALGLSASFAVEENNGGATQQVAATVNNGATLTSAVLKTGANIALKSDTIAGLAGFANISSNADTFTITLNTGANLSIDLFTGSLSIQGFLDKINTSALKNLISANYDTTTGKLSITATDSSVNQITLGTGASTETLAFGFGSKRLDAAITDNISEVINLSASAGSISTLQTQYDAVRAQIDALVSNGDTGYRGTNLLNGDNLLTVFNEDRTSSLTTTGQTFTSAGLGLSAASFGSSTAITAALDEVRDALSVVRNFGSSLAGDLSTIQTRQTFTSSLINTLKEGSDLLVNADQNEEGAKLLALQTRQSLGVTALSLASQSQQSILRLFG